MGNQTYSRIDELREFLDAVLASQDRYEVYALMNKYIRDALNASPTYSLLQMAIDLECLVAFIDSDESN